MGGNLFSLKRKGLKGVKTTGTRNSLKAGTRVDPRILDNENQESRVALSEIFDLLELLLHLCLQLILDFQVFFEFIHQLTNNICVHLGEVAQILLGFFGDGSMST